MIVEKVRKMIEDLLDDVETVALGIVKSVDLTKLRCNVRLKHKIKGQEIELFDVPIACLKSSVGVIFVPPKEGDVVLVVFSKYELEEQLKSRDVVDVNEFLKFNINNAIVFGGVFTLADSLPKILPDRINIIGDVYVDGDLDFKTIRGVNAEDGVWHKH